MPRQLSEWDRHSEGRWRGLEGTLVSVDISGFTALSERLARRGRIGAEELTEVLNYVFGEMLAIAYGRAGSLLKFGGDALLLLFAGPDHPMHAGSAAVEMQKALRASRNYRTSSGRLRLRMSVGVHSGTIDLFRVGESHRELIITGPAASITTRMEATAVAGEIVVSDATRAALPSGSATERRGEGWLLRWRKPRLPGVGWTPRQPVGPGVLAAATPAALRDFLRQGAAEPEHHIATVAFVKFTGIDRVMGDEGPAAAGEALDHLIRIVQRSVDDAGVTFLASDIDQDGGKIILVAGVPEVQEDDAGRVLRAARRIVDDMAGAPLAVKLGVNQGHVFVGDIGTEFRAAYTIMGDTVNVAARLMAAAPAGAVYVGMSALASSSTTFETETLEPLVVKGKKAPLPAAAIGAATGRRAQQTGQLPFTGRDDELARLRRVAADLAAGRGRAVTVVGERGSGKTRLARELLAALGDTLNVEIQCEPHESATPYRPIRGAARALLQVGRDPAGMGEALRSRIARVVPDMLPYLPLIAEVAMVPADPTPEVDALDPRFRQARTADLIAELLVTTIEGPIVFHIEDGQHMDEASVHIVNRIVEATDRHPWLVLTTMRSGSTGGLGPVGEVIELGPLADSAVRELVHSTTEGTPLRPHDVDAIVRRAGGMPLFLDEILRVTRSTGGTDALPDSLEAVVSAQIDQLPPLSRKLMRFASVLGQSFWTDALRALLSPENVRLDAATRRQLAEFIEPDGPERLRFRHALLRDVAYGGLSFKRRRELHLRAAEAAERVAGVNAEAAAADLAFHFSQAGEHERAWKYSRLAADRAAATYANLDAAVHYRRALDAAHRVGVEPAAEADVLGSLGRVCQLAGLYDEALASFSRAARLVDDDPRQLAALHLERAVVRRLSGAYRPALAELTRGLRLVKGADDAQAIRVSARLAAERAAIRRYQQRPGDALAAARVAERHARAVDDLPTLGESLDLIHWAHLMTGDTGHKAPYAETLAIYESLGDQSKIALVWNNRGADAYYAGRWNDAIDAYRQSSDAERRSGNEVGAAISDANTAEILINQGRYDEAEPILVDSLRVLRASGHAPAAAFVDGELARLLVRRGDLAKAEEKLHELRERSETAGELLNGLNASLLLAEAKLLAGQPSTALDMCREAQAAAGELAEMLGPAMGRVRALALAALGRPDDAMLDIEQALATARAQGLLYDEAMLLRARISIMTGTGAGADRRDAERVGELSDSLGLAETG